MRTTGYHITLKGLSVYEAHDTRKNGLRQALPNLALTFYDLSSATIGPMLGHGLIQTGTKIYHPKVGLKVLL